MEEMFFGENGKLEVFVLGLDCVFEGIIEIFEFLNRLCFTENRLMG